MARVASWTTTEEVDRQKLTELARDLDRDPIMRTPEDNQERANKLRREAQDRQDALELVFSYAKDIVDFWPKMTLRTLSQMTSKVNALREALELVKR